VRAAAAALGGRLRLARPAFALRAPSPRLRRRLVVLAAVSIVLAAGYQFWLRDSSFVSVDEVEVTGLTTGDAKRLRAALKNAGYTMTTLHVDHEALEEAVAHYPVVRALEVTADFPHGLRIHVIEHHPAARVALGGREVAVAADGTVLRSLPVERRLPAVEAKGGMRGDRLSGAAALAAVRVAGTAPAPLRRRIARVEARKGDGLVAELRDGPELIFGAVSGLRAKWVAAARVLADPHAAGATYIDLRLPGRPAAGGLPAETVAPVAPAGQSAAPAAGLGAAASVAGAVGTTPGATGTTPGATGTTPGATMPGAVGTTPGAAGTTPGAVSTTPAAPGTVPGATTPPGAGTVPAGDPTPPATAPSAPQAPATTGPAGAGTVSGGVGAPP
jgi:cell division protein FtsQ